MPGTRAQTFFDTLEPRRLLAGIPTPDHVVVLVEENHSYDEIIGNPDAPFLNALAQQGASLADDHAVAHPSQPNYLALFSGSTQGVADDNGPLTFNAPNLGAELISAGRTFAGYSEDLPSQGSTVLQSGQYARKHNPWSDFSNVPASDNKPFTAFPTDFAQLPTVAFVVPNLDNDMHDGSIAQGDQWAQQNLGAYATWAKTHNSVLIVTFDEDDGSTSNQVPLIFSGQPVAAGDYGETSDHYSLLATIQDMYNLPRIANTVGATPISDVWAAAQSSGQDTFLGDLNWTSATIGYGTIHKDQSVDGNTLTLNGATYAKGIGTHAVSQIDYNIAGQYARFVADVGVDDETGDGAVRFQVVGDGAVLFDSGVLTQSSPVAHVDVSVAGVQKLSLIATNGVAGSIDYDHADWAGAKLLAGGGDTSNPTAPAAPTNLVASVTSSSAIDLSWNNPAGLLTSIRVERSLDGSHFTTLKVLGGTATSYSDTGLSASTKYYYRVYAANDAGESPASVIASATTLRKRRH